MATRKLSGRGKTRTREHVLAELAVNHVERHVLLRGFSVERVEHDYGIDLVLFTYNAAGELESGRVLMQVKATDKLRRLRDGKTIAFAISRADLKVWLHEADPVVLVVYDGERDRAYWLYVQAYFEENRRIDLDSGPGSVTVRINPANRLNRRAMDRFARYRDDVLSQIHGRIRHRG